MESTMGETPEGLKQDSEAASAANEIRVNGEINGPCKDEAEMNHESSRYPVLPSKLNSENCDDVSKKLVPNDDISSEITSGVVDSGDDSSESENVREENSVNGTCNEISVVHGSQSEKNETLNNVDESMDEPVESPSSTSDNNARDESSFDKMMDIDEFEENENNATTEKKVTTNGSTTEDQAEVSTKDSDVVPENHSVGLSDQKQNDSACSSGSLVTENCVEHIKSDSINNSNEVLAETTKVSDQDCSSGSNKNNDKIGDENSLESENCDTNITENNDSKTDTIVIDDDKDEIKVGDSISGAESADKLEDSTDDKSDETPGKIKKSRKSATLVNITPRRSSRNIQKTQKAQEAQADDDDPDIEEITPEDPLAGPPAADPFREKENTTKSRSRKTTIVVNDTKRLVEIAAGSKPSGKKEPTLVIIDTNSILSGRGPVPVSQSGSPVTSHTSSQLTVQSLPHASSHPTLHATPNYPPLPAAVPAQGMYPPRPAAPPATKQPQILPTLTDDMYVVEAPSFIVPYVYEKPPLKPLKEFIEKIAKEVEEDKRRQEEDKKKCEEDKKQQLQNECSTDGEKKEDNKELKNESESKNDEDEDDDDVKEITPDSENKKEQSDKTDSSKSDPNKPVSYFDNPLGKFFIEIGSNLVQEYVQVDLLRTQKKKLDRDGGKSNSATQFAISSLLKNLEFTKENNEPFHLEQKKCEHCSFKTESSLVMAQHLETPHMRNYVYRCNFCPLEVRSPHDILFHMEAEHNVRGKLERAPAFHQCPNCPFEDNQKGKLSRHLLSCAKKFRPEKNLEPPPDWEPPAKIPRISRNRPPNLGLGTAAYQALTNKQNQQHPLLPKLIPSPSFPANLNAIRGRGRPPVHNRYLPDINKIGMASRTIAPSQIRQNMLYRTGTPNSQMLLPTTYQIAGNQLYQVGQMMPMMTGGMPRLTLMPPASPSNSGSPTPVALVPNIAAGGNSLTIQNANKTGPAAKLLQQPSISITPLPRQPASNIQSPSVGHIKQTSGSATPGASGKATFVICEICDGYIKDLEQLRNHMQWIHKVKIHPKMIYNRPPLNCQKCQFRFFTDQGLERHLLGSHGLVTSSMQEAANKGKDGGRCPVCGRVYQWKLLNHVARDHNMTLKPAHLSYKCTVCTATFGMYKQFENHVYSAHSVVAKRAMDKKPAPPPTSSQSADSILKPLKINDEITIIPQPARHRPGPASRTGAVADNGKVYECEECEATYDGPTGFSSYLSHVKRKHTRKCGIKLCRLDACPTCKRRHVTPAIIEFIEERRNNIDDVIELSDDEMVIGQGRNEITITKVSCAPGPKRFKLRLAQKQQRNNVQVIEIEDSPVKPKQDDSQSGENGEDSLNAVKERLRRRKSLEISQVDGDCPSPQSSDEVPAKRRRRNDE